MGKYDNLLQSFRYTIKLYDSIILHTHHRRNLTDIFENSHASQKNTKHNIPQIAKPLLSNI